MRTRTKRRLLYLVSLAIVLAASGFLTWLVTMPLQTPAAAIPPATFDAVEPIEAPKMQRLSTLLNIRLQGPLKDPPPKVVETKPAEQNKPPVKPQVNRPDINLECIFFGEKSKLAVFTVKSQRVSCSIGEQVSGATVEQILPNRVELSYQGIKFLLSLDPESEISSEVSQ